MKNKIKLLFLILLVLTPLIFPHPAKAIIVDDIMAPFDTALNGIEEASGPVYKFVLSILLAYAFGLEYIYFAASLLVLAMSPDPAWFSISSNPMVKEGWLFTAGVANMFLILILIIVALAYILKIETFQAKQVLPKILIVAILINFSLVFIGMMVDVSNIFYNTFLNGNKDLPYQVIESITGTGWSIMKSLIIWLGGLALLFILPFSAVTAQLGFVMGVLLVDFLPTIAIWLIQIFLFFTIGNLFMLYAFLFAARVFVIQILAMIAPLAFLCLILPQTKKWWDEWLKHLIEWLTFGVLFLFFLALGLRAINAFIPPVSSVDVPLDVLNVGKAIFIDGKIPEQFIYYFFLCIYLFVVIWFTNKFTPVMAATIIAQFTALGGFVMTKGLKPMGGVAKDQAVRNETEREKLEAKKKAGKTLSPIEKAGLYGYQKTSGLAKWGLREAGTSRETEIKKATLEQQKKLENLADDDLHKMASNGAASSTSAAALNILAKRDKVKDEDVKELDKFFNFGVDKGSLLSKRPDLAGHDAIRGIKTKEEAIKDQLSKMSSLKDIQVESLKDFDVYKGISLKQLEQIAKRGSQKQKEALGETHYKNLRVIHDEFVRLRATGDLKDKIKAGELFEKFKLIQSNDEFVP